MSTSTTIRKNEPVKFLSWLYHRLNNKHNEDEAILVRLADIIHNYSIIDQSINIQYIDKLCSKHFAQFNLDDDYGFTNEFKNQLRHLIIDVIADIGAKFSPESPKYQKHERQINNFFDFVGK